jgi:hypothetical protein
MARTLKYVPYISVGSPSNFHAPLLVDLPPRIHYYARPSERWPSGRRHSPAKGASGHKPGSRVRIPPSPPRQHFHAPVAQLDRVLGYEPRGQEFESLRAHQYKQGVSLAASSFFISNCHLGVNSGANQKIATTQISVIKML